MLLLRVQLTDADASVRVSAVLPRVCYGPHVPGAGRLVSSAVAVAAYPCGKMVKNNCLLTPERLFSARVGALI